MASTGVDGKNRRRVSGLAAAAGGMVVTAGPLAEAASSVLHPAFAKATTAGNLLVFAGCIGNGGGATDPACSDGTWTKAVSAHVQGFQWAVCWYKANCGSGETSPTWTSSAGQESFGVIYEVSGMATVAPLDRTASGGQFGVTSDTVTAAGADAKVGEFMAWVSGWANAGSAPTFGRSCANATLTVDGTSTANVNLAGVCGHGVTTGNGSADALTVTSTLTANDSTVFATFKLA